MSDTRSTLRIGVLGAGNIGRPIGRHWVAAGHRVTFGSRTPERLADLTASLGDRAHAATFAGAVAASDVVLLSFPHAGWADLPAAARAGMAGKIVIDATNPMALSDEGRIVSTLDPGLTQGRRTARELPDATVVRAFTHVMDELLWSRGTQQRHFWGMAYAGDDSGAKDLVAGLVRDAGFTPVDLGGLDASAPLDPGGAVFPHMFTPADLAVAAGLAG
ncbi:NAD(P)-binding domain-containing protein [Streptomyces sp. SP17BM10]|uniref:NADPH-dependent F420 reductase n=1 Tax=Streptomyces sp. SP17BM10 TaxID=3002530 RepID=UPI002E76DE8F|nr:NAD(P)-binding domain-containing protein [Streptomyces sp. SP17BM10]MEE1784158.1 NAD(P)-binding domain-containing protein [Streptomyces sp. SP17BM10]